MQAGGQHEATALTITGVGAVGAEVQGEGSRLTLTHCTLHIDCKVCRQYYRAVMDAVGMHLQSSNSAHLSSLSGPHDTGVVVPTSATAASGSHHTCMHVCGIGRLRSCTLSGCCDATRSGADGLVVRTPGSVHAATRHFLRNQTGCSTKGGTKLNAVACSPGNRYAGFRAHGQGSVVDLKDCTSQEDQEGCVTTAPRPGLPE